MNYLLVMPKKLSKGANTTSIIFPLGIAYVSAALKHAGFHVFTANLDFPERDTRSVLQELIPKHDIDVICTGGLSLDCHKLKEVIDVAREIAPRIISVVGGGIISSDPETAMRVLGADIGVIGEGEATICELADALDHGRPYDQVAGLIYRDPKAGLVTTSRRKEIEDLDTIPFPDFEGFNYGEWVRHFGGAAVVLSERSCPFRCTFCFHPTGEKYRQRSLDNVFQEIEEQVQKYSVTSIGLSSELFSTDRGRVAEFCARMKVFKLSWSCCLRVPDVDRDLLTMMRDAGCNLVCYGFESADNSILRSMRKGITVEQIERAIEVTAELGISTEASNFIFGDINETMDTVKTTMDFWWKYNSRTHINLSLIQTYPGTHLYKYACEKGIIRDKEQFLRDGCPIINVSKLSAEEFQRLTSMLAEYRMHPHAVAAAVKLSTIKADGSCQTEYVCRKCRKTSALSGCFWFTATACCPHCSTRNEVDPFLTASCSSQRFFEQLPADPQIALWGSGGLYYKLSGRFSDLTSGRFHLVDADPERQGLVLCRQTVHAPESIRQKGLRSVIITALSRKDEIRRTIQGSCPSVRKVLVPELEIDGTTVVPVLRPLTEVGTGGNAP